MSMIKPLSAYKRNITKLFELHRDDFVGGSSTWTDRINGVSLSFLAAPLKDSNGVYSNGGNIITVTGTLPTKSGKLAVVVIGKAPATLVPIGVVDFGLPSGSRVSSIAINSSGGADQNTTPSIVGNALSALGAQQCRLGYVDYGPTPITLRADANNQSEAVWTPTTGSSISGAPFTAEALPSNIGTTLLTADGMTDGRRLLYLSMIQFASEPSPQELLAGAIEMASTGELYSGWVE